MMKAGGVDCLPEQARGIGQTKTNTYVEVACQGGGGFAAPNMIAKVGATPVFVGVELIGRNLDFDAVERAITPRTKAIMPTHFAGLPVDMDRLYAMAERHGVRVIEDAALAIGSTSAAGRWAPRATWCPSASIPTRT